MLTFVFVLFVVLALVLIGWLLAHGRRIMQLEAIVQQDRERAVARMVRTTPAQTAIV